MSWIHDTGVYRIINKAGQTSIAVRDGALNDGAEAVGMQSRSDRWCVNQFWKFEKAKEDKNAPLPKWTIQNLWTGKYLSLQFGNMANRTPVQSDSVSTFNNHYWFITDEPNYFNYVRIKNVNSGTVCNLKFGSSENGSEVTGWESGNYDSQRWMLVRESRSYGEIDQLVQSAAWCKTRPSHYNPSADAEYIQIPTDVRDAIYQEHLKPHKWRFEVFDCDDFSYVMKAEVAKWGRDNMRADGVAILFGIAYGDDPKIGAHAYNFHMRYNPDTVVYFDATWNGIEETKRDFELYMIIY